MDVKFSCESVEGLCRAEQDRSHVDSTLLPCSLCGDPGKGVAGVNPLQKQSCVLSGVELSLQNRIYKEQILTPSEHTSDWNLGVTPGRYHI